MATPTNHEISAERKMKTPEQLLRALGGYSLGFAGLTLQLGGILHANLLSVGGGLALSYAGHRIIDPLYNQTYGASVTEKPKPGSSRMERIVYNADRFARFNIGLIPKYIGVKLLVPAILGGAGQNAAERVVQGFGGAMVMQAGSYFEAHMHTRAPLFSYHRAEAEASQPVEAHVHAPTEAHNEQSLSLKGLWKRVKTSAQNYLQQPPTPVANPVPATAAV